MLIYTPPFQTTYVILLDNPQLKKKLKIKYGKYLSKTHTFSGKDIDSISCYSFTNPVLEIDRYIFHHTTYDENILALHGAAVEWNGQAYLFLAATTSGKTTLASYLTNCGCGYLTDDCILIERANLLVHPYTTPIQLRDGGLEVLKKYQAAPNKLELLEEGPSLRRWVYTPENCIEKAIPLRRIFFIERTEKENCLIDMNTTERITALMKSPITNYNVTGDYLRLLARIAKIDCHILRYCDMQYVKELIQNE